MKFWLKPLAHVAKLIEHGLDSLTDHRFFSDRNDWQIGIRTYATYGDHRHVRFRGRVLRDHSMAEPTLGDAWYKNLLRTFHALESDEVSGARVELTFRDNRRSVTSDAEGYVDEMFELDGEPIAPGWHEVFGRIEAVPYGTGDERQFQSMCLVPDADAADYGIISDIDDTVLQSEVTRPLRMLRLLIFGNAETRAAVEGVTELYQSFVRGRSGESNNPVFYVSSSPWNLEPMLAAFMRRVGLPAGPMMLRDLGIGRDAESGLNHGHKEVKIRRILEQYPSMRFVLLGDAGQEDAAIYSRICDEFGDQVIVAYIRQVGSMPSDRVVHAVAHAQDRGTPVLLLPGTKSIVADALSRSLIATETAVAAAEAVEDSDESVLVRAKSAVDPDDVPVTGDEPLPASATASS